MVSELGYALRRMTKGPGFAVAVAMTLALGIGANTAAFSLINSIVFKPLPYPDSDRLYTLFEQDSLRASLKLASYPTFVDWHEQSSSFDGLAFVRGTGTAYRLGDRSGLFLAAFVSEDFFPTLGTPAAIGRSVIEADYSESNPVVVLSHGTWLRSFGGDSAVVGQTIRLAESPFTIIGVMPPQFAYPNWGMAETNVWLPMTAMPPPDLSALMQRDFNADSRIIARLRSDVSREAVQAEMDGIAQRLAVAYPAASAAWTHVSIQPVKDFILGNVPSQLFLLAATVGFVLLVCCVNLANLYLAQGAGRRHEFAIRAALGAARARVGRQVLIETAIVSAVGGAIGVVLAIWTINLVRVRGITWLPRLSELTFDWKGFAVAGILTVLTALLFAAMAVRKASSPHLASWLGQRSHGASTRSGRLPSSLLAAQVALTVVLLVGAALLTQSFVRLTSVELGFEPERLVMTSVQPPSPAYDDPQDAARLYDRAVESVRAVVGVEDVALINHAPVSGGGIPSRAAIGGAPTGSSDDFNVLYLTVSAGYFEMLGIPVLLGREFTEDDLRGPPGPLIISEAATRQWADDSPLGTQLGVLKAARTRSDFGEALVGQVVGVVGDIKHYSLASAPTPIIYVPYTHNVWPQITLVAKTAVHPGSVLRAVDDAVRAADPAIPLDGPGLGAGTMENRVRAAAAQQRMIAVSLSMFAIVALLLASVGIYGVMSYTVTLERHDIGIRMALGAAPSGIQRAVVGRVARITAIGLVVGVASALGLTRLITGLLYETAPTDPMTFVVVSLVLIAVAMLAAYLPARRAAHVDPAEALRAE